MKKTSVALVLVLATCAAAVPVAQAVTPKTGLWKSVNKTQPSQKEKGKIEVFKSKAGKFSLRTFHDAVLAQGTAPLWEHRRLLLNEATDGSLE